MSGTLAKVTKDDPRYDEWRTTKGTVASRKKKLLKEDPLEYAKTFGVEAATKRAGRAAQSSITRGARTLAKGTGLGAASLAPAIGAAAVTLTASLALLAAGYVVMDRVAKNQGVKLGDRLNAISNEFVNQQNALIVKNRVRSWAEVPSALREKAVANYKRALSTATSQAQGSAFAGARAVGSYK